MRSSHVTEYTSTSLFTSWPHISLSLGCPADQLQKEGWRWVQGNQWCPACGLIVWVLGSQWDVNANILWVKRGWASYFLGECSSLPSTICFIGFCPVSVVIFTCTWASIWNCVFAWPECRLLACPVAMWTLACLYCMQNRIRNCV